MEITKLGVILFPLDIVLFIVRPKILLYMTVFFFGWTGASVLNISGVSLQPSYLCAMFWFANQIMQKSSYIRLHKENRSTLFYVFIAYCSVTIVIPLLNINNVVLMDIDGRITYLKFTSSNIIQLIYLLYCAAFYWFICKYINKNRDKVALLLDIYCLGVFAVCMITIYQIFAFSFRLPFDEYFRQSVHGSIQGIRIYGPCVEASMLCCYLVPSVPICLHNNGILGILWKITAVLCVIIGLISYSTTFILGILVVSVLELNRLLKLKTIKKRTIWIAMTITAVTITLISANWDIINRIVDQAYMKLLSTLYRTNFSGKDRTQTFLLEMAAWSKSPLYGWGFGSSRGKDLFCTWMCNIGVIGMSFISAYILKSIKIGRGKPGIVYATISVWLCMMVSVPEPYSLYVWFYLAILNMSLACQRAVL